MWGGEMTYAEFLDQKAQIGTKSGFKPVWLPGFLFDFQIALVEWALEKGRASIFADCGLGKTPMQLVWAENVRRHTNKPILLIAPLAVSAQTIREGQKFGIECHRSHDGKCKDGITITNYERLHMFDSNDYAGVVCDESSAIKNFDGERQKVVTQFMRKIPYRLLCTATAAPNDYIELGTSAEALGELGRMDMLSRFFRNDENSNHPIWWGARWQFKAHAEEHFWRWVCSWARALRRPSDIGFSDRNFILPPLVEQETVIECSKPRDGELFIMPAITLKEQRAERRDTMEQRCEIAAEKCAAYPSSIAWCHLNQEGDLLTKLIEGAVQVSGEDADERKEEVFLGFQSGEIPYLVTKPKIGSLGLNLQRCHHMTFFPSHSFEQYYQGVRRCWRFGQKNPVTVDVITTPGEIGVLRNLQRKSANAAKMFDMLVKEMNNALRLDRSTKQTKPMELPAWL